MSSERSVVAGKATVVLYDDASKKWVPSGGVSGAANVIVLINDSNNQSRVVGRRLEDKEVGILCLELASLLTPCGGCIFGS